MEKLIYKHSIKTILLIIFFIIFFIGLSDVIKNDWGQILSLMAACFFVILYFAFSPAVGLHLAEDNKLPNKWFWAIICFMYPIIGIRYTRKYIEKLKSKKQNSF